MRNYNEIYSDAQQVLATAASTNVVDHGAAGGAMASEMYVVVDIDTAYPDGTSVQFVFQTDDNASFSTPKSLFDTGAIVVATLVAGYNVLTIRLPRDHERYTRFNYTVVGSPTAGNIHAYLTPNPQLNDQGK